MPFVTTSDSDNNYDSVSNLNREGVFRINIGVSKETFNALIHQVNEDVDYSKLNVFLPHPDYSRQNFVCILNPVGDNIEKKKQLIEEAHSIADKRFKRKKGN